MYVLKKLFARLARVQWVLGYDDLDPTGHYRIGKGLSRRANLSRWIVGGSG